MSQEPDNRPDILTTDLGIPELQIPDDIKKGLENSLAKIPTLIKTGNIELITSNLSHLLNLAATSRGSTLEFSDLGKEQLRLFIENQLKTSLNSGANYILNQIAKSASQRSLELINHYSNNLLGIIDLANKYNIDIDIAQPPTTTEPETRITKNRNVKEVVEKHINEVIGENLLTGIATRINWFTEGLDSGSSFGNNDQTPESKITNIEALTKMAVSMYNFETTESILFDKSALENPSKLKGVKQINPEEISTLIREILVEHLPVGVHKTMENFGRNIANLPPAHITFQVRNEVKEIYQKYGEKLGLIDNSLEVLTDGKKYNLNLWNEEIHHQVVSNFNQGLQSIVREYQDRIKSGHVSTDTTGPEMWIGIYSNLAKEHGITMNAEELRQKLILEITPENIQAGLDSLLGRLKHSITDGDGGSEAAQLANLSIPRFLEYIKFQGLEEKVDTEPLLSYIKTNGLELGDTRNRLTRSNTSIKRQQS